MGDCGSVGAEGRGIHSSLGGLHAEVSSAKILNQKLSSGENVPPLLPVYEWLNVTESVKKFE